MDTTSYIESDSTRVLRLANLRINEILDVRKEIQETEILRQQVKFAAKFFFPRKITREEAIRYAKKEGTWKTNLWWDQEHRLLQLTEAARCDSGPIERKMWLTIEDERVLTRKFTVEMTKRYMW